MKAWQWVVLFAVALTAVPWLWEQSSELYDLKREVRELRFEVEQLEERLNDQPSTDDRDDEFEYE